MVTREEILNIAKLAKLFVSDDELERLTSDMNEIIRFADTINSAVSETTSFDGSYGLSNVLREDNVVPSYGRGEILKNASEREDGYFLVKRRA